MFAHPLNGLKGLDASIFLSAPFGGGGGGGRRKGLILPSDRLHELQQIYPSTRGKIQVLK